MNEYIIHYDIASILLLITILVHYRYKRTIKTNKTTIFNILVWLSLVTTIIDVVTVIMIQHFNMFPLAIDYMIDELDYIWIYVLCPVFFYIYILAALKENIKKLYRNFFKLVPALVSFVLIIVTDIFHTVFYFDNKGCYNYGPFRFTLYIIAAIYLVVSVIKTFFHRDKLSRRQETSIYFFTLSLFVAMIIQAIEYRILLVHFSMSLAILLSYLALENPDDYSDNFLGIFNKRAFKEMYTQYINNENPFKALVLMIDGQNYIQEVMGTDAVNLVYKQITDFLGSLSKQLTLYKLSDSKFALMSRDLEVDIDIIIKKINEKFSSPFKLPGSEASLSVVMCILSYPDKITNIENIPELIQYSLQKAKLLGEKSVVKADETVLEEGRRENKIIQIMKNALRDKTFEVYYQPIYSVEKKQYTSAEALIRLKDEELGFISPEEFIPLAERNGMILEIGEFVFREVCKFISSEKLWEKGIEYIDVNLSVVQCMQEKLHEKLLSIMDEYNIKYSNINLEITETAAVLSSDALQNNMQKLREQGIKFSLDDYGTGFSNMTNLINYAFHTIKLDKSLLWAAMEDEKAKYALEYTIGMVKAMNMELVAEGVETKEQSQELEKLGCDFFQGYYYSKPICKEEFCEKINNQ